MISSENFGSNYNNFESKPNVPKFNGVSSSSSSAPPTNRVHDRLKNQHHEELRRRASYQKVFADVKNASESPIEVQPFTRPTEVRPLQTIQGNQPQADTTFQTIKKEAPSGPTSQHSTDDSDADDTMSPTHTPVVQIATAPTEIAQNSQPVLVHLNQPGAVASNLPYSNANLQTPIGLPSYTDMSSSTLLPYSTKMPDFSEPDMDDYSDVGNNPDMIGGPVAMVEEAARKREVRLLKNREAARECRRKKKEYIKCLENRVQVLESQNKALIDELKNLKEMYCINKQ